MKQKTLELLQEIIIELAGCGWSTRLEPGSFDTSTSVRGVEIGAILSPGFLTITTNYCAMCHISVSACPLDLSIPIENLYRSVLEQNLDYFFDVKFGAENENDA